MPADLGVLGKIAAATRRRVAVLKLELPIAALKRRPLYARIPRDFAAALAVRGPAVIAEIKFASPSRGTLRRPSSAAAVRVAGAYLGAGASALSILTEPEYFKGSPEYLAAVRRRFPKAALLMKDFVLEPYQLHLARSVGADAVLLITALLKERLKAMLTACAELRLQALVEVHTRAEIGLALRAGAKIVGVNSRDLRTLKTDLGVARRLARAARATKAALVAESGIKTAADIRGLAGLGYQAFLVGTSLMGGADPGRALRSLRRFHLHRWR